MIRINLLKQPARKKVKRLVIPPKLLLIGSGVIGVVLLCIGGWWAISYFNLFSSKASRKSLATDDFVPSSLVSSHMVEEVVDDLSDSKDKLKRRGILDLPYEQLSFVEKVNYEIHYAKNVFDLLSRTALPGVDFTSVKILSFKTLQGTGLCDSKENVTGFFKTLKKERIELHPKPKTQIRRSDEGYKFTISGSTQFGLNLEAPFLLGPEDILTYDDLDITVKKVADIAKDGSVRIQSGLNHQEAFFVGDYRRLRYHFSATSSYNNFIAFINNLYVRQIPCAFEEIQLSAVTNTSVKIEADIIFTTSH